MDTEIRLVARLLFIVYSVCARGFSDLDRALGLYGKLVSEVRHWRARANQIAVAVNIVYAGNAWPVLALSNPWGWERGNFAAIRMIPILRYNA